LDPPGAREDYSANAPDRQIAVLPIEPMTLSLIEKQQQPIDELIDAHLWMRRHAKKRAA
jgi:hypothetical protein